MNMSGRKDKIAGRCQTDNRSRATESPGDTYYGVKTNVVCCISRNAISVGQYIHAVRAVVDGSTGGLSAIWSLGTGNIDNLTKTPYNSHRSKRPAIF